jgi:hypothetical protein
LHMLSPSRGLVGAVDSRAAAGSSLGVGWAGKAARHSPGMRMGTTRMRSTSQQRPAMALTRGMPC